MLFIILFVVSNDKAFAYMIFTEPTIMAKVNLRNGNVKDPYYAISDIGGYVCTAWFFEDWMKTLSDLNSIDLKSNDKNRNRYCVPFTNIKRMDYVGEFPRKASFQSQYSKWKIETKTGKTWVFVNSYWSHDKQGRKLPWKCPETMYDELRTQTQRYIRGFFKDDFSGDIENTCFGQHEVQSIVFY